MQALARFIMRGQVQAIGSIVSLALLSLIVSPLAIFTTAGVALVTLVHGYREGLKSLFVATVVITVFTGVALNQPAIGLEFALKFWLPSWFLASIVLTRTSMSLGIVVAAALSCLLVSGFYLFTDPAAHWQEVINKQLLPMLKEAGMQIKEGPEAEKLWLFMSTIMTGSAVALFLALQTVSLLLARWWQALLYNPAGFAQEFRQLRFGVVAANIALLITVFVIASANEMALNLFFIAIVLMMFQGLAVVHNLVAKCKLSPSLLFGVYLFMLFTLQHGAIGLLLIALIGLIDNWLNLRFRLCAKSQNELH
ncbi:MAG: YybS family protein [Gammaproteobacteria bacterium]|nr:YybS family protein [Gammaproteobacteria bacterium]